MEGFTELPNTNDYLSASVWYHQPPLTSRPLQPSSSLWAASGQHELRPWQGGVCQASVEHACWPGRPRPSLQGQLELDCSRTALRFISDQEEEDSQRGEDWQTLQNDKSFECWSCLNTSKHLGGRWAVLAESSVQKITPNLRTKNAKSAAFLKVKGAEHSPSTAVSS